MDPIRQKTSYHAFILIAFHLNCLPDNLLVCIPKSTRFDWVHKNFQDSFGFGWYQENKDMFLFLQLISQHKKILKLNKALLRVIAIRSFLKKHSAALSAGSSSMNMAIFGNIQKVAHVIGLRKALRFIDLDFSYYAKLCKNRICLSSIFDLRLLEHPSQLLKKEITIIKSY